MSYATIDGIFARFPAIKTMVGSSDRDVTSLEVSSVYIADAEGYVDAFLNQRYTTPMNPVEPVITQIASDLTIFNMMAERLPKVPDFMQARYDRSNKMLEMFRDGKMSLNSGTLVPDGGDQEVWSSAEDFHPVFSPVLDALDQQVDTDRQKADSTVREGDG